MDSEQLRESLSIPNMEATHLLPEEPRLCQQSPNPVLLLVMEMMETISWEEYNVKEELHCIFYISFSHLM